MKGDPLPNADRVSHYVKPSCVDDLAAAFMVKETNPELSVNWLEYLHLASDYDALTEIARCLRAKGLRVKATGLMAVISVGKARQALRQIEIATEIEHDPDEGPGWSDPSHSVVKGFPSLVPAANAAAQLLEWAVLATHPVAADE